MKPTKPARILFVDDHPLIAHGLALQLKEDPELNVCGTASSYVEAMGEIEKEKPDIVVTDLSLGDGNGMDLVKTVKESQPSISCIILSMHNELAFAGRCIRAGAKGYISKDQPLPYILNGIRAVAKGDLFLSENVKQQMMDHLTMTGDKFATEIDELSDREFEIMHLIAEGLRPRQISEKLVLSPRTINTHCQNIRTKLHLSSMDDLIDKSIKWFKQ
ncbi:response regulator transcription factor [bacterium]|nr:response regulator transcription factor [bacterium]